MSRSNALRVVHIAAATADDATPRVQLEAVKAHDGGTAAHSRDYIGDSREPRDSPELPPIVPRLTASVPRMLATARKHGGHHLGGFTRCRFTGPVHGSGDRPGTDRRPPSIESHPPAGRRHRRLGRDRLSRERRSHAVDPMSGTSGSTSGCRSGSGNQAAGTRTICQWQLRTNCSMPSKSPGGRRWSTARLCRLHTPGAVSIEAARIWTQTPRSKPVMAAARNCAAADDELRTACAINLIGRRCHS